jgi:hypothetical protein
MHEGEMGDDEGALVGEMLDDRLGFADGEALGDLLGIREG